MSQQLFLSIAVLMNPFFEIAAAMVASPPKYEPLKEQQQLPRIEEEDDGIEQDSLMPRFRKDHRTLRPKIIGLSLCLGSLILVFLILVTFGIILHSIITHIYPAGESCSNSSLNPVLNQVSNLQKPGTFTCGTTADEARALGCQWDIMTMSWEHPDCFDPDLTREFEELGPWQFYWSSRPGKEVPEPEMLSPIPPELVSEQTERIWTDRRYHIMHCIYAWKMMHRAVERGWKMQGELTSYHHTEHCSQSLANTSVPMDAIITKANVQFPAC
jgi:hypothetical protein